MAKVQRDSARERHWRELVSAWRASGLSVRAFCSERQVKEPAFYAWRRELQKRAAANAPPSFVPVTVVPTPALVEVRCPSGHIVTLAHADHDTLRHLFAALGPASC
jgi:transposase-like protein